MPGRPFAEDKYDKFVTMLRNGPRTVKDLANKLKIGQRTVYTWLDLAKEDGYSVMRAGFNPTKWSIPRTP